MDNKSWPVEHTRLDVGVGLDKEESFIVSRPVSADIAFSFAGSMLLLPFSMISIMLSG